MYGGQWKDGVAEGNGAEIYLLGQYVRSFQSMCYVGQFRNGKPHGYGEADYSWCDGRFIS